MQTDDLKDKLERLRVAFDENNVDDFKALIQELGKHQSTKEALQKWIQEFDYYSFRRAAAKGKLEILRCVGQILPTELPKMISVANYLPFREAAANGHKTVLEYLMSIISPEKRLQMVQAEEIGVFASSFTLAARNAHVEVLQYLGQNFPEQLPTMINDLMNDWIFFRELTKGSIYIEVLKYVVQHVPTARVGSTFSERLSNSFASSPEKEENAYLLGINSVLNCIEGRDREKERIHVRSYIDQLLLKLRKQRTEFEKEKPDAVYDVSPEDGQRYFYCLRNLIRRGNPACRDDLRLLLSIPAVKSLVHPAANPNEPNVLFCLALETPNNEAAELLLQEELHHLARDHFKAQITHRNWKMLQSAWDKMVLKEEFTVEENAALKSLDIKGEHKKAFIKKLEYKYPMQWNKLGRESWLHPQIERAFVLKEANDSHAGSAVYATTNWQQFLQETPHWKFLSLLFVLEKKQQYYSKHSLLASAQAQKIIKELNDKAAVFYPKNDLSLEAVEGFKTECIDVLVENSSQLQQHRGFLGAFFAAIHQFFVALKAFLFNEPKKYSFFDSRSDGAKILDTLAQDINGLSI